MLSDSSDGIAWKAAGQVTGTADHVLQSPCRSRSHRGFCDAKVCAAGDKSTGFCLWLCPGTERAAIPLPGKKRRFPKVLGVFAAAAQVSYPVALQSGVSQVFSLKEPHLVETAGECPFALECQTQTWHQSVFTSCRCDSTAWSWSIPCSKGSVLERLHM